jgi:NhaP-type Na+/H+ or K+/H+ antiporter
MGMDVGKEEVKNILQSMHFNETLLHGMLAFLLFAGAMQINLADLRDQKWTIALMATFWVVVPTFIVGSLTWLVLDFLAIQVSFICCLLIGALISPTDPSRFLTYFEVVNNKYNQRKFVRDGRAKTVHPGSATSKFKEGR